MRVFALSLLLLAPMTASAANRCAFEAPRNQTLDLTGVRAVQISVHGQDLKLVGASGSSLVVTGRACASEKSRLDGLKLTQRRDGDQLILDMATGSGSSFSLFGSSYANLELAMQLPANLPVTVDVGSGDVTASDMQQLDARVGSGDLDVSAIRDRLKVSVGSGDVKAHDLGALMVSSLGSGDLGATTVRGDVTIGSIGSGDVTVRQVGGSVRADTLGSGDLNVHDVAGGLHLGAKGSGDIGHSGVKGRVDIPRDDD